jgi:hypothetical protein
MNNEDHRTQIEIESEQEYDPEECCIWFDKPEDFDSEENTIEAADYLASVISFFDDFDIDCKHEPHPYSIGFRFENEYHRDAAKAVWESEFSKEEFDE